MAQPLDGLRELLGGRLAAILAREACGSGVMRLYLADGYWTAFEESAYELCRLCPDAQLLAVDVHTTPQPVVTASVAAGELHKAVCGLGGGVISGVEAVYEVGRSARPNYRRWHNRATAGLRALRRNKDTNK